MLGTCMHTCKAGIFVVRGFFFFLFFFRSPQPSLAALAARLSCCKSHLVLIWMSGLFEASAVSGVTDGPLKGPEQQDVPLNAAQILTK